MQSANSVNGIIYLVSAIASPFTGMIIDKTGRNIMWIALSIIVTGFAHGILIFTLVNPYVGMVSFHFSTNVISFVLSFLYRSLNNVQKL